MEDAIALLSFGNTALKQKYHFFIVHWHQGEDSSLENSKRRKAYHFSDLQVVPRAYADQSATVNLMLSVQKYLLAIPRKKILGNLILSIMYGKVLLIISPLRQNKL